MSERSDLLASIADTIKDYREGELSKPTPDHVDRWVKQFNADVQVPMLREMNHVLKITYFPLARVTRFLTGVLTTEKLVGDDPISFWRLVRFLNIQGGGNSQREMLAIFGQLLEHTYSIKVNDSNRKKQPTEFIYLDDVIFTGNRVRIDLGKWISEEAPDVAKLHIVTIALHLGGQYFASKQIAESAKAAKKKIDVSWWRCIEIEDRKYYINSSDVLRPTCIPDDRNVQTYVTALKYSQVLRTPGNVGKIGIFSSEEGRHLLEQEFLKAGVRIRSLCSNLNVYQRPLGNMVLETLGFGSLLVTFRNCPNNAPLALWVGDPWYPLFARTTNTDTSNKRFMAMFAKDGFDEF